MHPCCSELHIRAILMCHLSHTNDHSPWATFSLSKSLDLVIALSKKKVLNSVREKHHLWMWFLNSCHKQWCYKSSWLCLDCWLEKLCFSLFFFCYLVTFYFVIRILLFVKKKFLKEKKRIFKFENKNCVFVKPLKFVTMYRFRW